MKLKIEDKSQRYLSASRFLFFKFLKSLYFMYHGDKYSVVICGFVIAYQ